MFKKALSLFVAALLVCSVCLGALAEGGTVTFWLDKWGTPEVADAVVTAWSEAAGTTIEYSNYVDVASYQTAMSQSLGSDAQPDMFTWWSGEQLESLMRSGKIVALDDVWEQIVELGVSPDVKDAFTYDGSAYAVPFSLLYNVVIYNTDAFAAAGIEAVPATFDEFLEDCQKLVDAGITPIGIKNDSWASFIWFQAFVAAFDPELYIGVCDGSIHYTDERVAEVLNTWQEMIDKGYFADPVAWNDNFMRFANGEVAMLIEPQTALSDFERDYGLVPGENVDAFALPSVNGDKAVVFFEAAPIAVPTGLADEAAAKAALTQYFAQSTQEVTGAEEGIIVTNTVQSGNAIITKIIGMAGDTDNYRSILRFYENTPSELRDLALDELSKFMYGYQDAATTLANIQVKADETFAD